MNTALKPIGLPDAWGLVRKVQVGSQTVTVTADDYGLAIFLDGSEDDPALLSWGELDHARKITGEADAG